jgi:hypothetical protein
MNELNCAKQASAVPYRPPAIDEKYRERVETILVTMAAFPDEQLHNLHLI